MTELGIGRVLIVLLTAFLSAISFWACGSEECPTDETPDAVTLSGRVLALPLLTPVARARIEVEGGSLRTRSRWDGSWTLEGVPTAQDPFLKIDGPLRLIPYPTSYNSYPLSLGLLEYDLQVMNPVFYFLLTLQDVLAGADRKKLCLVFGAAVGFASMDYPQVVVPIEGVTVSVIPDDLTVTYLSETGSPDPTLEATTAAGAFYLVVPDATAVTSISLTATKPGTQIVGPPSQPTRPGSFVLAGLIDPSFAP